jgi:hypothetical protein
MSEKQDPVIPVAEYQEAEGEGDEGPAEENPADKDKAHITAQLSSTVPFDVHDGEHPIGQRENPSSVYKRVIGSVFLVVLGIVLIAAGFWSEISSPTPGGGVPFWVIGVMLLVPGLYCIWDGVTTLRQQEKTERQNILKPDEGSSQDLS